MVQEQLSNLLQVIEQQGHVEKLERALLQVMATPGKKGQAYCDKICFKNKDTGYFYRDFSQAYRNVLAVCLKDWRLSCGDNYIAPDSMIIRLLVSKASVESPDLVTDSEADNVVQEWAAVLEPNELLPAAKNEDLASAWMKKARFERAVKDSHYKLQVGGRKVDASKIVERLHRSMAQTDLSGDNTGSEFMSIDDILRPRTKDAEATTFYSTGVPVIDSMLGGGYARGYSYLHVTGSGGGKSVHATTNCVNLSVRQGLKGLWVSTEEPANEIYTRVISNYCGILHEELRAKLSDGSLVLSPTIQTKFDTVVRLLRENVLVKRWIAEDYNVAADLQMEIEGFREKMGCDPHYIIFDWLGASTEELGSANGVRNSIKAKSYEMDAVGKKNNITVLYYMQAGESFRNERHITQAHVDECKTAGQKAAACMGWSFMPNKGDGTQVASNGVHADTQVFSIGKSRFGKGGYFTFKREFAIQRFLWPK